MPQTIDRFQIFVAALDPNTGWVICPTCAKENGIQIGRQAGELGQLCAWCGSRLRVSQELPG